MQNDSGPHIGVGVGLSSWSPQCIMKPNINSDWIKISSRPNCLKAFRMGWNEESYSLIMLERHTDCYKSLNKNPRALIIGPYWKLGEKSSLENSKNDSILHINYCKLDKIDAPHSFLGTK